ncbi:hypothetical protein JKP88DRAFT_182089, partial [Tribonema minus]
LPHTLRELDLSAACIQSGPLPPHLTSLSTSQDSGEPIGDLPITLERLAVNAAFEQRLGHLPACLKVITSDLDDDVEFDQLFGELPPQLQVLDLISFSEFNQHLDALPCHLLKLTLGCGSDQPLGTLPDTLEELLFYDGFPGSIFNHPLGTLPKSLRKLRLSDAFDHPLGLLPSKLEYLECMVSQPLAPLPCSLQHLLIWNSAYHHDLGALPPSLVELRILPAVPGEDGAYQHRLQPIHPSLKAVAISRDYAYLDDLAGVKLAHNDMRH